METLTKKIIKEEIYLYTQKMQLDEIALQKINDYNYITKVLGINVPLNETYSLETRKLILKEHLLLENFLDSIKKFVGDKYDEAVDVVKNFKDLAILIKDLIKNPDFLPKAIEVLKKNVIGVFNTVKTKITNLINSLIKTVPNIKVNLNSITEQIENIINSLSSGAGWKNFLQLLGFGTLLKYVEKNIIDKVISKAVDFIKNNILETIVTVFRNFRDFVKKVLAETGIQDIIDWFGKLGAKTNLISNTTEIIKFISEIISPVIKTVYFLKKLVKKT